MSKDLEMKNSLVKAVRQGSVERARDLINSYGVSYPPEWSHGGYMLLLEASREGHTEMVWLLLRNNAEVNTQTEMLQFSNTPLHHAVENNCIEMVKMLIERGADLNVTNHRSQTPLHIATANSWESIVELLLNAGSEVNLTNDKGETALHIASMSGCLEIAQNLLNHGADIDRGVFRTGYTPLHIAVENNDEQFVTLLLGRKANVNATAQRGMTPLHVAAVEGNEEIAEKLLNHGASLHSVCTFLGEEDYTPLQIAAKLSNEVVILLLEHGAQVDAQDKRGKTILQLAVENKNSRLVKNILKHCPDMNIQSSKKAFVAAILGSCKEFKDVVETFLYYGVTIGSEEANNSALMHAAVTKGYLKIVEDLLNYGTDVDILDISRSKEGFTPLHTAVTNNQGDIAKLLIVHGANINAKDNCQKVPIYYAIKSKDEKLTQVLLENGADLKNSAELLNAAVSLEMKEVVKNILQHDVDINAYDKFGITALHCTVLRNYRGSEQCEMAELLLSNGANANAKTIQGVTTLHVAAYRGHLKTVQTLLNYNADVNCVKERNMAPNHPYFYKTIIEGVRQLLLHHKFNKFTALHFACFRGREQVVEILLKHGAQSSPRDTKDLTPLHIAAQKGFENIIKSLLTFSADIDSRDLKGRTALHYACSLCYEKEVEILLNHGAEVSPRDKENLTPLHIAARCGFANIIEILLTFSADTNTRDLEGKTPLDYAFTKKSKKAINALLENGADINMISINSIISCVGSYGSDISNSVKKHIVKLQTLGLYISEEILQYIRDIGGVNISPSAYEAELKAMKGEKINNSKISFYDIIRNNIFQITIYARNKNIIEAFEREDYKTKNPEYADMIKFKLRKGIERNQLIEKGTILFDSFFESLPALPHYCSEKILNYLDVTDLRAFIKACESLNRRNTANSDAKDV